MRLWTPGERLTLDEALRGYTAEGAWAWHAENELGVLRVGAAADVVVWSANLYEMERDPAALLEQQAALTIVAGEIVHDSNTAQALPGNYGGTSQCSSTHSHDKH